MRVRTGTVIADTMYLYIGYLNIGTLASAIASTAAVQETRHGCRRNTSFQTPSNGVGRQVALRNVPPGFTAKLARR